MNAPPQQQPYLNSLIRQIYTHDSFQPAVDGDLYGGAESLVNDAAADKRFNTDTLIRIPIDKEFDSRPLGTTAVVQREEVLDRFAMCCLHGLGMRIPESLICAVEEPICELLADKITASQRRVIEQANKHLSRKLGRDWNHKLTQKKDGTVPPPSLTGKAGLCLMKDILQEKPGATCGDNFRSMYFQNRATLMKALGLYASLAQLPKHVEVFRHWAEATQVAFKLKPETQECMLFERELELMSLKSAALSLGRFTWYKVRSSPVQAPRSFLPYPPSLPPHGLSDSSASPT